MAVLEMDGDGFGSDILHANDWQLLWLFMPLPSLQTDLHLGRLRSGLT